MNTDKFIFQDTALSLLDIDIFSGRVGYKFGLSGGFILSAILYKNY